MSKRITVLFGLMMAMILAFGVGISFLRFSHAETALIENSDFFSEGEGVSARPGDENTRTEIVLPYNEDGVIGFGENAEKTYAVDLSIFTWNLRIDQLAVGQSFAISFLKDASQKPLQGAVGISFVFECVAEGSLIEYVVDAANGKPIQEMIDSQSMWAYKKDGTFEEYPKVEGEENYSHGMVGKLNTGNIVGAMLTLANNVDSASFGGTTNRPAISGGGSLGTTIPGEIFSAREMDIRSTVLVLSAGGLNGIAADGEALRFTAETPADRATKNYLASSGRMEAVNRLTDYLYDSQEALAGELSQEEYNAMIEGLAALDLSDLRVRDRFVQSAVQARIEASLAELGEKTAEVPNVVTAYSAALQGLENLNHVNAETLQSAFGARAAYRECALFVKYLRGEELDRVEQLVRELNETLLTRAETHLQIAAYEAAVARFSVPVSDTAPEIVFAAEQAGEAIDRAALDTLNVADKTAFEKRIAACDRVVEEARFLNAFDVENYKIAAYRDAVSALRGSMIAEEFVSVLQQRPSLKLGDVMPADAETLKRALAAADTLLGAEIVRVLDAWFATYSEKTFALQDLSALTRAKIDAARAAVYDGESLKILKSIADEIGYDVAASVEKLSECDRVVAAAEVRLLLTLYHQATTTEISDFGALTAAYDAYTAVEESDLSQLSDSERSEFDRMLSEANAAYEAAAKALILPLVDAFEAAIGVENIAEAEAVAAAKDARAAVPSLYYLIVDSDREAAQSRYDAANDILLSQTLYYASTMGTSWSFSDTERGLLMSNRLTADNVCNGLAVIEDPLQIDGFDFAFEFTKIGRIWKGEDPVGSGIYPQSILVMNILREAGKNKDEAQGFSIYFYCNHLDEMEVNVYGAATSAGEVMLASGKVSNAGFTAEDYQPYTVRIRIEKGATGYRIYVNSLQLNVYFRDIVNPEENRATHLPEYDVGSEIGADIFKDGNAFVTFVIFANSLTSDEERESEYTVRMIGNRTFGDYVPPVYTVSVDLVSGPAKTVYEKGESFDKTGIRMTATLSDGTVQEIALAKIKVLGFTSTSKGKKNVTLSYTDDTGVTLNKVIQVEIVEAQEENDGKKGCGGVAIGTGAGAAVLLSAAVATVLVVKKVKKS